MRFTSPLGLKHWLSLVASLLVATVLFVLSSCQKNDIVDYPISDLANLSTLYGKTTLASNGSTFTILLPFGTSASSVTFTLKVSPNASLYEGYTSTTPLSLKGDSITLTRDLTTINSFKVVSESSKVFKTYDIKAEVQQTYSKDIKGFSFLKANNPSLSEDIHGIILLNHIGINVPLGTKVDKLVPTIYHNGASVIPDNQVAQNFTNPVTYIVNADDNTTKAYIVNVGFLSKTTYTITFNTGGGSVVKDLSVIAGEKAKAPTPPTNQDSLFGGWYIDAAKTKIFDFDNTPIAINITLYAKWYINLDVIFFDPYGFADVSTQTVKSGEKAYKPTDPVSIEGHPFEGWYADANFVKKFDFESTPIKQNTLLYASWRVRLSVFASTYFNDTMLRNTLLRVYPADAVAKIIYFTPTGAGTADGSSWKNARKGSSDNLKITLSTIPTKKRNRMYVLLLGEGTYQLSTEMAMQKGVAIIGGWANGWTRGSSNVTTLSGSGISRMFNNTDIDSTALLYGLNVTSCNATGKSGGAMYNSNASPTIKNVHFSSNKTDMNGGAMYNDNSSSPTLTNVTFSANTANMGGGLCNNNSSSPILTNVTFSANSASIGGGMYNGDMSASILTNVTFSANNATTKGGGLFNLSSSLVLANALFWKNTAPSDKEMYNTASSMIFSSLVEGYNGATSPFIRPLANNGGIVQTMAIDATSSAVNAGLYIQRSGTTLYYSPNKSDWYTDAVKANANATDGKVSLPTNAIDLTASDARDYKRLDRPDLGAYEFGTTK